MSHELKAPLVDRYQDAIGKCNGGCGSRVLFNEGHFAKEAIRAYRLDHTISNLQFDFSTFDDVHGVARFSGRKDDRSGGER